MKLIARLLLILPFSLFTIFYLRFDLDDNRCSGLIDLVAGFFFLVALIITFIIAVVATFRKRPLEKFKAEPFSLTALLIVSAVLAIGLFFGENLKGGVWMRAESDSNDALPSYETLIFRKNKSFVATLGGDDFGCRYTGTYELVNDTIILDQYTVSVTERRLTTHYLFTENSLLPLTPDIDSTLVSFHILQEK